MVLDGVTVINFCEKKAITSVALCQKDVLKSIVKLFELDFECFRNRFPRPQSKVNINLVEQQCASFLNNR